MKRIPWSNDPAENVSLDYFAGGGGASEGIEDALERPIDYAINHDPEAIAMYRANHPGTETLIENVWRVDPRSLAKGRPVDLTWLSPDCTHFSKAKGGKPVDRRRRALASVAVRLAKTVRPRKMFLENVEEFEEWGPLLANNLPNPAKIGLSFRRWWRTLENLGYRLEMRQLRACDFGAPTSRNRLYIIARCDEMPIVWPDASHGIGMGLDPYRIAAECVDWSIPMASIFMSPEEARMWGRENHCGTPRRPLREATLRRIARGVMRYVINSPRPFIVPLTHQGSDRVYDSAEPFRVITGAHRGEFALVQAFLARHYGGHENDGASLYGPLHTITSQDHHALVTAHIQRDFGASTGQDIQTPLGAITGSGGGKAALVASSIVKLKGTCRDGQAMDTPLHTVQAGGQHYAAVQAFLMKYYGTDQNPRLELPLGAVTTRDRFALVTVHGEPYAIYDIRMRMFKPRELFRAQGFGDDYVINPMLEQKVRGKMVVKELTPTAQIRMCGNSVSPPVAEALVRANSMNNLRELAA